MPKAQSRLQSCMPFRAFRANVSPQAICLYNHIIYCYYMLFLLLIPLLLLLLHVFIIVIIIVYYYYIIDTTLLTPFQLFPSTFPSCSDHRQRVLASSPGSRPPRSTASAACAGASSGSVATSWTPGEPWPEAGDFMGFRCFVLENIWRYPTYPMKSPLNPIKSPDLTVF